MTTLADLVPVVSVDQAVAQQLALAAEEGLSMTAFQPVGAVVALLNVQGHLVSDYSGIVAGFAQAGYASTAATMTDSNGAPIQTWAQLRAAQQFNVEANLATFASGSTPYGNSSATTYPYSPNAPLRFQHPTTGSTYTSTGTGTLVPGGGTIPLQADVAGSAPTAGAGITLVLLTPFQGVTLSALTNSVVGLDAESNQALPARCTAKLGSIDAELATRGPARNSVYYDVATGIPQGAVSASPPYAVSAAITQVGLDISPGAVDVYLRNANGAVGSTDVAVVQAAIDALVTPDSVTVTVASAAAVTIQPVLTVYLRTALGLTSAQVVANIEAQLDAYFAIVPIGGVSTSSPNILPTSDILEQVAAANPTTVDVLVSSTSVIPPLGPEGFPVRGTTTITVAFV
jgi:hypothetical protein